MASTRVEELRALIGNFNEREFTYPMWRFKGMSEEELQECYAILIEAVETRRDFRAALTLGELDCREAIPAIEALRGTCDGLESNLLGNTLAKLTGKLSRLGQVTQGGLVGGLATLLAIDSTAGDEGIDIALDGLTCDHYITRSKAFEKLIELMEWERFRLSREGNKTPLSKLGLLRAALRSEMKDVHVGAATELNALVQAALVVPEEELNLEVTWDEPPEFLALMRQTFDGDQEVPVDDLMRLSSQMKEKVRYLMSIKLGPRIRNLRIPLALARLAETESQKQWTRGALLRGRSALLSQEVARYRKRGGEGDLANSSRRSDRERAAFIAKVDEALTLLKE